jgi:Amt family ammonium transporter
LLAARALFGKADLTMALNGALAGLVSITADPLSPTPLLAIIIGAVGGLLVVGSIVMLDRKFRIDDPVGAISVHGTAGIWGVLAVLLSNGDATVSGQLIGLLVIFSWVFLASLLVWFIIKKTVGVRVTEQQEYEGVDLHECGLEAYPEFTKAGD